MLSNTNMTSIQRRRTQHRRQNSTPAAFEAPTVRPLPANIRQHSRHRTGMSLDLRGLNLDPILRSARGPIPEPFTPVKLESYQQDDSTVSITNLGQPQQHHLQVAQTHSTAQPGSPVQYLHSSEQQYPPSPQTPHRSLHQQQPAQPQPPTEQQLKELHEHISKVYGSYGQVFVNILPTPITTPQKPARLPSHEPLDTAPMPSNLSDMAEINLDPPTGTELNFTFENPESDMGYESSSYYTSDALSPGRSPCSSPRQKSTKTFLEDVEEYADEMAFSQPPPLFLSNDRDMNGHPDSTADYPRSSSIVELDVDASIEYTGIAPEDVQRFISEQDPNDGRWSCLYPECDKTFGRRENIRSHVQTHLGDRQFRCNGCGKCFVRQHDLKRHSKIHTGTKPYKCPCSAGFARQDALTRHRQRGMCVGGFPDAVRREVKRGRPKKSRPDFDERVKKSGRTRRRALASAASSSAGGSPPSDYSSPHHHTPQTYSMASGPVNSGSSSDSFGGPLSASSDPFSFDNTSSPYSHSSPANAKYQPSSPFEEDETSMNLLRQLSAEGFTQTPPMSPSDHASPSEGDHGSETSHSTNKSQKTSSTPSDASLSNQFTTPPTSPVEPIQDSLDDLFNDFDQGLSSCSQYDLEMKAMTDFTSFDNNEPYEMLDFM
ncbi:uncharacterized protein BDZ99DRAFT_61276 [Mytilinidion resinicola]|uniref:C2H2 type master regulator of conidiophore development brlA n=1 Tax=Mytilinidion resinicola TaxID=574789 RepID=A0A6A6YG97_9PEZI|nr:uncharacterized protein BDZ99DRAFT_61276 [Mytilinidion resinicola]KAF2807598.1 hypothetical protein BDZ99DRAFT_61276 [Mytilinidion resinicola]